MCSTGTSAIDSHLKICPYPFKYNAEYRKVEAERPCKEDSDSDDEKNSNRPTAEESEDDGEMSSLETYNEQ